MLPPERKKTVRRDAKEIYKGLHKPYIKGTPLDNLFSDLEQKLEGSIDEITFDQLVSNFLPQSTNVFNDRYFLTETLFNQLLEIQRLSMMEASTNKKDLITISLHDIKTFSKVVNILIIHSIYPVLNVFKVGIPLGKRRLKDFNKPIKIANLMREIDESNESKTPDNDKFLMIQNLATLIYDKFYEIFNKESDVKTLLTKGTGYSDFLTISILLITCPYFQNSTKYASDFGIIMNLPSTFELFQTFSLYLSSPSAPYFKKFVLDKLNTLHYDAPRKDGLLTLIEFVLGLREHEEINIGKFNNVASIVLKKPASIPTVEYFTNIGNQSYDLLVNINRPYITSCVGHIIETLWRKNKLIVQDFFFKRIWTNLNPETEVNGTFTSEKDLNNSVNVLISLIKKDLSPEITQFLFKPILLSLWGYYVFLKSLDKSTDVIVNIFVSYFVTVKNNEDFDSDLFGLDRICKNLIFEDSNWEFSLGVNGLPQISKKEVILESKENKINNFIMKLDRSCKVFLDLLKELDDSYVVGIFKTLLKRWLRIDGSDLIDDENPFFVLIDLRLIESIGNEFKEDIAKTPIEMLQIVNDFLKAQGNTSKKSLNKLKIEEPDSDDDSDDEETDVNVQALPILFELLSAILTEIDDDISSDIKPVLQLIVTNLDNFIKSDNAIIKSNINACTSLSDRIKSMLSGTITTSNKQDNDSKVLKRAITNLNDPLVPIRAHGLYLLRQLIETNSKVISLDFVIELHLNQLKDPEPFIYLNVIKGLISLTTLDVSTVGKLLSIYVEESDVKYDLDERLKIGEVLINFIQNSNELFTGTMADNLINGMVSMIRRHEDESKNQDNRIRMSSMSILGICCKVNPLTVGKFVGDILDCAFGILQLETDKDSNIMRRSAVVLINDLTFGCIDGDIEIPIESQTKIVTVLQYIFDNDNDLLTREQAKTVLDDIKAVTLT